MAAVARVAEERLEEAVAAQCELLERLEEVGAFDAGTPSVAVEYWHEAAKLFADLEDLWRNDAPVANKQWRRRVLPRLLTLIEDRQRRARAAMEGRRPDETPAEIEGRAWNQCVDGVIATAAVQLRAAATRPRSPRVRARARRYRRQRARARAPDRPGRRSRTAAGSRHG